MTLAANPSAAHLHTVAQVLLKRPYTSLVRLSPGYFHNILAVLISDLLLTSRNTVIAGTLNLCLRAWIHVLDPCIMAIFFFKFKNWTVRSYLWVLVDNCSRKSNSNQENEARPTLLSSPPLRHGHNYSIFWSALGLPDQSAAFPPEEGRKVLPHLPAG